MAHKEPLNVLNHCGYYLVKWTNKGRHFFPRFQRVSNSLHDWCLQNTPDKNLSMLKKQKSEDPPQMTKDKHAWKQELQLLPCAVHVAAYTRVFFWCNLIDTYVWKHANFFFFLVVSCYMITAEVLSCVLNTYGNFCVACPAGKQTVDSSENVSKLRSNNNKLGYSFLGHERTLVRLWKVIK